MVTLRDENLGAHQVDSGDHLRDRVLHLNSRIDFDEIKLRGVHIVKKLDRSGIAVTGLASQLNCGRTQLFAHARRKICRGRDFDNFLMAALHGAIALVQMQQLAMLVAENLHFQMTRASKIFLEEDGTIAEGRTRFTLGFLQQALELGGIVDDPHATPASTHGGLDHQGIANFLSSFMRGGGGFYGFSGTWKHANPSRSSEAACRGLVAQQFQEIRSGTNKFNADIFAGARKCRVFREESVTRVDGVNFFFLGKRDDAGNVEISLHRAFACSNLIGLIGFEAVQCQTIFL